VTVRRRRYRQKDPGPDGSGVFRLVSEVGRGEVEAATFRFSDVAIALVARNLCRWLSLVAAVAVTVAVSRTTPTGGKWTRIARADYGPRTGSHAPGQDAHDFSIRPLDP
jgi:hypothetical protein